MRILVLSLSVFFLQVGYSFETLHPVEEILNVLNRVYVEAPGVFRGAKIGVEVDSSQLIISQENIVAELERDLEFDKGHCEYETQVNFIDNMRIIEESLAPRAARIIRKLRNNRFIEHISTRTLTFQSIEEDCVKQHIRIILKNGSLIWIDFN